MARRKKKQDSKIDVSVVVLILISVLLGVLIYFNSGVIGKTLSPVLGGLMGFIKYILPIATFAVAVYIACDDKKYIGSKLLQYAAFLLCIMVIMATYQISAGFIDTNKEFSEIMKQGYELGSKDIGGGVIGVAFAYPLISLIGMVGTVIVCLGVIAVLMVLVFKIKPSEMLSNAMERREENKELRLEEKGKLREERRAQRQLEREESKKGKDSKEALEDQITINLNGRKEETYKHDDDLIPAKKMVTDDAAGLFKKVEEEKEDKTKEILQLEHALIVEEENYEFPPINLLKKGSSSELKGSKKAVQDTAVKLQKTLQSFGVAAKVENVSVGPAITRYELKPAEGVRVNKIANLSEDIALNLAAETIRIEAPIPGKQAVGIEIPNKEKEVVHLRDIVEAEKFQEHESKLAMALGKDVGGESVVADIAKMPHVLIAGSTGSGKSVCINTLITSVIYKSKPSEVKLVMIDPKVVELSVYNGIPHLLIPVVTDPRKAAGALAWAVQEMDNRYNLFARKRCKRFKRI